MCGHREDEDTPKHLPDNARVDVPFPSPGVASELEPIWLSTTLCGSTQSKRIRVRKKKRDSMSISATKKAAVIGGNRLHATDSGSPEVQVAVISERISTLQDHFKANPKDHHSRRGLLLMVGRRNRLLTYLARVNRERYNGLIKRLGLRK
jgi:small subunit ribosomal protein S15